MGCLGHHGRKVGLGLLLTKGDRFAVDRVKSVEALIERGDQLQLEHGVFRPDSTDSANYFSSSRSRVTVTASVLKKPLTIFSSSSPATGSSSKFPFLASATNSGSFKVA